MRDGLDNHDLCKNSLLLLINGKPRGFIRPFRGICQGDPTLSPFLFLLCSEGLHGLIQHAANLGEIKGFPLCRRGPDECRKIIDILEKYEGELGQKVNKNKTAISFSKSTVEATKQQILAALGLQEVVHFEQYLGLPSLVGRRKERRFQFYQRKGVEKVARMGRHAAKAKAAPHGTQPRPRQPPMARSQG